MRLHLLLLLLLPLAASADAIHDAAAAGNVSEVRRLLQEDPARLHARNPDGWTPLLSAAYGGSTEVIALLLDRGASLLKDVDVKGSGPLHFAAYAGKPAAVRLLLDRGADAALKNRDGNTALDIALGGVSVGAAEALELLTPRTPLRVAAVPADRKYRFDRTISRETLNRYLSRAVTHYGLCSTSPEPATAYFWDDMRMLTSLGAKFAGRAAYAWVPPDDEEAHFRRAAARAGLVHRIDPDMILQAAIFEAVYESVGRIPVPEWVFEEFGKPVEKRNFRYEAMLYGGGKYRNHWTAGASVPDMSQLETRMYFYYRARGYIDSGFEAIHFGQVLLMDDNDPDHHAWWDLLSRVRRYAAGHARRRLVLCDAHCNGIVVYGTKLLFDFHSFPLMAQDVAGQPMKVKLVKGYYNSIYGRSAGGTTPSGWRCDWAPYLCEFDSGGSTDRPGQPSKFPFNWGYCCADWFVNQPAAYQKEYLAYAHRWLVDLHEDGWLQVPTRLNIDKQVEGQKMWHANTRSPDCPVGFGVEAMIREVWK